MAQPTRGDPGLKYCGMGAYIYFGTYIIRRRRKDSAWEVRDYADNLITTGKTLKEATGNIGKIPHRNGGEP